jgi:histidinol dehydrogenase
MSLRVERIEWDGEDAPRLAGRLRALAPPASEVTAEVERIVERVRDSGDAALREIAESLGEQAPEAIRVDPEAVAAGPALVEPNVREALRLAARNIETVARAELEVRSRPATMELPEGHRVEVREEPVASAGVYAPGGRGSYASSVLMCCIPARVAGVLRICVASPPGTAARPSDAVLAACSIAGVDEVYALGGAQAIAALALGTETVERVDLVAGPGSRYVTEAKRLLSATVGIDGIAGPSELMVVADGTARPEWIALDLCAQAEHGEESLLVVASPDAALLERVGELVVQLAADRPSVARARLALVASPGLEGALTLSDHCAPEHLQLTFQGADETAARGRVAGCVFVGRGGATALGDYAAGSNHVLPTGGAARFGGPLGPGTFRRRVSVVDIPRRAATALAPHVVALSGAEGFPVHGESATARAASPEG